MALTRAGCEVLESQTIWLCASCYACSVECPRQIRITDIMYELKQRAIRTGVYPKHLPTPVLAREFGNMVARQGRITESYLVMLLYLKTNWIEAMGNWRLGLGLIQRGRFPSLDTICGCEFSPACSNLKPTITNGTGRETEAQ
jgi:heterodisulfide reductase subunit C